MRGIRARRQRGTRSRSDLLLPPLLVLSLVLFAVAGLQEREEAMRAVGTAPTPGSVPDPQLLQADQVLITEVMANPTGLEPDGEWIEIISTYSVQISLSGWSLQDNSGSGPTLPSGAILDPGQVWLLANSAVDFQTRYGFPSDHEYGGGSLLLANSGDRLGLFDASMTLVDALSYGSDTTHFNPPAPTQPDGSSLERLGVTDTDAASDWVVTSPPTPGIVVPESGATGAAIGAAAALASLAFVFSTGPKSAPRRP